MRAILLAASALVLSACASPADQNAVAADRDCFRAMDVSGFNVADNERVKVRVGPSREYLLTIQGGTRDLRFDETLAIDAGPSFVCTGNGLGVSVIGGDHNFRRAVTLIERAPPRETAAAAPEPN